VFVRSSTIHQTVASFILRAQQTGWSACVRQVLSMPPSTTAADINSSWTAAFAIARAVGGNEAVEVLYAQRTNMESMLMGTDWKKDAEEISDLRTGCLHRCDILESTENPVPMFGWLMAGEKYMFNSPRCEHEQSYDHAFAVLSLGSGRLLLLHSIDNNMRVLSVDRRLFWTDVKSIVSSTRWSASLSDRYRSAFGVERDFQGRQMAVFFDASPLVCAVCAFCGRETAPKQCAQCHRIVYCSRICQKKHWSAGHKTECQTNVSKCN